MRIRTRLTLQFLLLGGAIMIIASSAIYISSSRFRRDDFQHRLMDKASSTANVLFNTNRYDAGRLLRIQNQSSEFLQNEKTVILNFKNDTIYKSGNRTNLTVRRNIIDRIRSGYIVTFRQGSYDVLGTLYNAGYDKFIIFTAAEDIRGSLHLEKLRIILTIVCLISLMLFFIAGWFYSGRALKPISNMVKKVEDISITSLNLRIFEGNGTDEIGRLAQTFNKMLERLETSFGLQKNFIANASHELRTPITSINGQLEVLMMKDRTTEEYKSALGSVLDDIKSLIDLSNRLLLIARTSAEGPANLNKRIRIDEILWQAEEEITKFNNDYRINISIDKSLTDSEQMIVLGDDYLLKVAVANLIDNACKYSSDHKVDIKFRHLEEYIEVIFKDRGIGISEQDMKKIFEPFFRGANAVAFPGSGIGLLLVNQIIKNHKGTLKLSSQLGKGTSVSLKIPSIS
jgi:signal transduction histidine kinase